MIRLKGKTGKERVHTGSSIVKKEKKGEHRRTTRKLTHVYNSRFSVYESGVYKGFLFLFL